MITRFDPLKNENDFSFFVNTMSSFLSDKESFKLLSYTLKSFEYKIIEELTRNYQENNLEYIVDIEDDIIKGILAIKRDLFEGFELFLFVLAYAMAEFSVFPSPRTILAITHSLPA